MATAEKQQHENTSAGADLRVVPIGTVSLRDGFNPRTTRDKDAFARTAWSVRETGVLQPVLVTPSVGENEAFTVVAGEGRYLAALQAGLEELPVIVREVDERTGGLELAMAENMAREELDPVAIAGGFARLKDAGWSKRQIAEELSVTQKLVTERLLILKIPAPLRPKVASGEIPLSAVRALARVGEIHPDLPAILDARVTDGRPSNGWAESMDWADVVEDPIAALTATYTGEGTQLPTGVYDAGEAYPVSDLPLSEDALVEAREIAELQGIELDSAKMRFAREALEQALSLKAAFPDDRNYSHLIVGDDVVAQILGDQITAQLKHARAAHEQKSKTRAANSGASGVESSPSPEAPATSSAGEASGAVPDGEVSVVEATEQRRRAREERKELQRQARALNEELGAAVLRNLVRLKIDERVLRVLVATDPLGDLGGLAMRGARYGLPGWTIEETTATGKSKVVFPDRKTCAQKASDFLQVAGSVGEIAGRVFSLIVMARYADERAVADSSSAGYELRDPDARPWGDEVLDLIDEICSTRLPQHLTEQAIAERREHHEREARAQRERDEARERLDGIEDRLADLSDDERAAALRDAEVVYGPYGEGVWHLRQKITAIRNTAQQAAAHTDTSDTGDEQPDDTHEPTAAGDMDAAKDNTPDEPAEPSAA